MPIYEDDYDTYSWRASKQAGMGRKLSSDELDALYTASKPRLTGGYIQPARKASAHNWYVDKYQLRPSIEMAIMIRFASWLLRLVWQTIRGSAYGIWLCLRPQLSVPARGWVSIGRGARGIYRAVDGDIPYLVPPAIMVFIVVFLLMRFLMSI